MLVLVVIGGTAIVTVQELKQALVDVVGALNGLQDVADGMGFYDVEANIEDACAKLVGGVGFILAREIRGEA